MSKKKLTLEEKLIDGLEDFASALERGDDVTEVYTCRKVVLSLVPTPYDPKLVKETRSILGASQAVFAHFLGVTPSLVQKWERGDRVPNKMACRFMDEIRRDPNLSRQRFTELLVLGAGCVARREVVVNDNP